MNIATIEVDFRLHRARHGRQALHTGPEPDPAADAIVGSIPRVARLLALALRFDDLIRQRVMPSYAALADLGRVTPARISQIMALLNLAPDIQEAVLDLPRTPRGRDPIQLRHLLPIARILSWKKQRRLWAKLRADRLPAPKRRRPRVVSSVLPVP
jgi:hypothetical protein